MRQPGASEARTHDLAITSPARKPIGYRVTHSYITSWQHVGNFRVYGEATDKRV